MHSASQLGSYLNTECSGAFELRHRRPVYVIMIGVDVHCVCFAVGQIRRSFGFWIRWSRFVISCGTTIAGSFSKRSSSCCLPFSSDFSSTAHLATWSRKCSEPRRGRHITCISNIKITGSPMNEYMTTVDVITGRSLIDAANWVYMQIRIYRMVLFNFKWPKRMTS